MRCSKCGTNNDEGRSFCRNCENDLRQSLGESVEKFVLFALLESLIKLVAKAALTLLDVPSLLKATRKHLTRPVRCPLCGAQKIRDTSCAVCEDAPQEPLVSKRTLSVATAMDWSLWAGTLVAGVMAFVLPVLAIGFYLIILLSDFFSSPIAIGEIILTLILGMLVSPFIFLVVLMFYNFLVFTSKEFLLKRESILSSWKSAAWFYAKSSIHLGILAFSAIQLSDQFQVAFLVIQIFVFISPGAYFSLRRIASSGLRDSLLAGYSANFVMKHGVVGRPGSSLDAADLETEPTQKGQVGEQSLAFSISKIIQNEGVLFNSLTVPGMDKADLDHVLVIGDDVMIVDSKNWSKGTYEVVQGNVWRDGESFPGGSVYIEELRHALSEYLNFRVDARVVILDPNAKLGLATAISDQTEIQLLEDFESENQSLVDTNYLLPNAGVLSDLVSLSNHLFKPKPIEDCLTESDLSYFLIR